MAISRIDVNELWIIKAPGLYILAISMDGLVPIDLPNKIISF